MPDALPKPILKKNRVIPELGTVEIEPPKRKLLDRVRDAIRVK